MLPVSWTVLLSIADCHKSNDRHSKNPRSRANWKYENSVEPTTDVAKAIEDSGNRISENIVVTPGTYEQKFWRATWDI